MRVCEVDGCQLKHFARGYCRMHYERWKRNGDVLLRKASGPCSVDGCDRRKLARGLCKPHYRRLMKYGDPFGSAPPPTRGDPYARWLAFVDRTAGCWNWTGNTTPGGYGVFWFDGGTVLAHRWSYEHHHGPLGRRHVDHLCRNRRCVNPTHLEAVTNRENLMRGKTLAAANAAKTHCPKGHPYDDENTYIDTRGARSCKICRRASGQRAREKKRLARQQLK